MALAMDGCPVEELCLNPALLAATPISSSGRGAGESLSSVLLSYILSICLRLMSSPCPRQMTVSLENLAVRLREGINSVFPISRSLANTC